jgi:hypothetical protein
MKYVRELLAKSNRITKTLEVTQNRIELCEILGERKIGKNEDVKSKNSLHYKYYR